MRNIGRSLLHMRLAHFCVNGLDRSDKATGGPGGTLLPHSQIHWFLLAVACGDVSRASEGAADEYLVRVEYGAQPEHLRYSTEMQFTLENVSFLDLESDESVPVRDVVKRAT